MSQATDQILWDAAVLGEAEAFGELFTRHHRAIYNYCFRRVSSWDQAEDLMSTVFLECWRQRQAMTLRSGTLLPWLIGIATRVTSHHHRSTSRRESLAQRVAVMVPQASALGDHADEVVSRVDDERVMSEVLSVLATLPQRDQDVIAACVFAELDYASAAEALEIPVGTVRSRLSRARRRLSRSAPHLQLLASPNS